MVTLVIRKYPFSQRPHGNNGHQKVLIFTEEINEWNTFSTDCVTASSMKICLKIYKYLRRVDK